MKTLSKILLEALLYSLIYGAIVTFLTVRETRLCIDQDKAAHLSTATALTMGSALALRQLGMKKTEAAISAAILTTVLGHFKESTDIAYDGADMAANIGGAVLGLTIVIALDD